jgi:hypothetical protein
MHEIKGNLFDHNQTGPDAICITTNGFVSTQGANTMGRGSAGEAKRRWPGIQMLVGGMIQSHGNCVTPLTLKAGDPSYSKFVEAAREADDPRIILPTGTGNGWKWHEVPYHILTFPTKPARCGYEGLLPYYATKVRENAKWGGFFKYGSAVADPEFPGWMARSDLGLIESSAKQLVALSNEYGFASIILPRPGCGAGERSWEDEVRPLLDPILDNRFWVITFEK